MNDQTEMKKLPEYQSHKKVYALKIAVVTPAAAGKVCPEDGESDGTRILTFVDDGYAPIVVDREYVNKHQPQAGGYYVVYADGYKSWSPAEAFESGYTRI